MSDKQRNLLITAKKVYCPSLPWSLRHISQHDALSEAREIAYFLRDIAFLELSYKDGPAFKDESIRGRMLVYKLMIDKIEIGMGLYKFPMLGWGNEDPVLLEREEE